MSGALDERPPLLEVDDLVVTFPSVRGAPPFRAVDGVTFSVSEGETVGLVGESGSGKSTIGRAIVGLVPVAAGAVHFKGQEITDLSRAERRPLSAEMQVVFQDPYSSLNPTRTVAQTLGETLRVHERMSKENLAERITETLGRVGLPASAAARYPAEFSGGQRQRIAIARALIVRPQLITCDEPVSALDLSVQAQVLNLLRELQAEFRLGYLFVAHDLAVVRQLSHRVVVLFRGRVMEEGPADVICDRPLHPYTQALIEAAPVPDPELQRRRRQARVAEPRSQSIEIEPSGCPFSVRCPFAIDLCRSTVPRLEPSGGGVSVACHRWREISSDRRLSLAPARAGAVRSGESSR